MYFKVRDGGGLSAISVINVTVTDIGDIGPVCSNPTLENQTYMTKKGETVTSLDNFCRARNYVSAVFYSQEVTYSLGSDRCNCKLDTYIIVFWFVERRMDFYATAASAMRWHIEIYLFTCDSPTKRNYKNKLKKSSCKDPQGLEH
jgi:hypothetical protein